MHSRFSKKSKILLKIVKISFLNITIDSGLCSGVGLNKELNISFIGFRILNLSGLTL